MHRFSTRETRQSDYRFKFSLAYLIAPALIIIFWLLANSVSRDTASRQMESLQNAINKDILHCYAVEGYYPPSLDYLKEHYGLSYDEKSFVVDYHPVGNNIRPTVTILISGE